MNEYKPVPVEAARAISETYEKPIVIIYSYDVAWNLIHTTTYGSNPENRAWAAEGGEIATRALGGIVGLATKFEDYRLAQAKKLLTALKALTEADDQSLAAARAAAFQTIEEAEKILGS